MISGITSGYLGGEIKYFVVQNNEEVITACNELNKEAMIGVDTENTGLDPYRGKPLLIQIGTSDYCYLFPAYLNLDLSPVKNLLEREDTLKVLFNAKYDFKWLLHHFKIRLKSLYDLQAAERVITVGLPNAIKRASLRDVVLKYLEIELEKTARNAFINRDPIASPITEEELIYSAKDASLLIPVYLKQLNKVYELDLADVVELECEVLPSCACMELTGSKVDEEKWRGLIKIAGDRLLSLRKKIEKHFEKVVAQKTMFGISAFNVDSTKQLGENLKRLGFELEDTGEDSLKKFVDEHPVFPLLLDYRGYSKIVSSYGNKFLALIHPLTGRIHANFDQLQADTGRFSSSRPNLQQVLGYDEDDPESLNFRSCFIAKPGYKLIVADFSQQELRILADMSDDPTFRKAYTEKTADGKTMDVHRYTASVVFGVAYDKVSDSQRKQSKCVHPDTLVFTKNSGYKAIKNISLFSDTPDEFLNADYGVEVLNQHSEYTKVIQTYNGGEQPLLTVASRYGLLVCTENHLFLTADNKLVRAADLTEKHILADPTFIPIEDNQYPNINYKIHQDIPELTITTNSDLAYFSGVFLGDGSASEDMAIICSGHISNINKYGAYEYKMWIDTLIPLFHKIGFNTSVWMDTSSHIYLGSRNVINFLRGLSLLKGEEQYEKEKLSHNLEKDGKHSRRIFRVPSWIIEAGKEAFLNFLGGMIDTDGWVAYRDGSVHLCQKDPIFISQIATLSQSCGLNLAIEPAYNKKYKRWYYKINYSKTSSSTLRQFMKNKWKKSLIKELNQNRKKLTNKVLNVSPFHRDPKQCLDISIGSEDNIYITNCLSTHNTLNFFLVYGGGAWALAQELKISKEEAQDIINSFFKNYSKIKTFLDYQANLTLNVGYAQTISGRKRFLPLPAQDDFNFEKAREAIKRQGPNSKIQGSGADVTKKSLIFLYNRLLNKRYDATINKVVHDEIVVEARDDQAEEVARLLEQSMIDGFAFYFKKIPMIVDAHISNEWKK